MSVEFEGIAQILKRFEEAASAANMRAAMQKACLLVEGAARQKAPKNKGDLRRSIVSRVDVDGNAVNGIVFSPLEYAPYVEYGTGLFAEDQGRADVPWSYKDDEGKWHSTSGQKPQPFMRPALNENREQVLRILGEGLSGD